MFFFPHFALVSMENTLGLTIQWNFITRFLTCSLGRQRGPFFSLLIGLVRLVVSVFGDALKRGWLISNEPLPEAQALKSALGEVSKVQSFGCLNVLWSLCKKLLISGAGVTACKISKRTHYFLTGSECCRKTLLHLIWINVIRSEFGDALSEIASNLAFWLKSSSIAAGFHWKVYLLVTLHLEAANLKRVISCELPTMNFCS